MSGGYPVVCHYPDVFPPELLGIPPMRGEVLKSS
jgi:hypothetical protein